VTDVLLLSDTDENPDLILPALALLRPTIRVSACATSTGYALDRAHIVMVDGRGDLVTARRVCRALRSDAFSHALVAVVTEGGMAGVGGDWRLDDVLVTTATPAEVEMRLRLAQVGFARGVSAQEDAAIEHGEIRIEPATRTVTVAGKAIALTYLEFQLLAYLARYPARVFDRGELLARLWGPGYEGGPRTIDVHIRRVRVALGDEHADHLATVRRVGYTFVPDPCRTLLSTTYVVRETARHNDGRPLLVARSGSSKPQDRFAAQAPAG
jgi:DNA-binding response OmpR family regulator